MGEITVWLAFPVFFPSSFIPALNVCSKRETKGTDGLLAGLHPGSSKTLHCTGSLCGIDSVAGSSSSSPYAATIKVLVSLLAVLPYLFVLTT
ncbi:hypothetical protein LZ32DRAFT_601425 [Colletotrichum eremochloae]|nr:hypothetical protein LZ32DRAFT_601425 [Colletotrichum eremochloae]